MTTEAIVHAVMAISAYGCLAGRLARGDGTLLGGLPCWGREDQIRGLRKGYGREMAGTVNRNRNDWEWEAKSDEELETRIGSSGCLGKLVSPAVNS